MVTVFVFYSIRTNLPSAVFSSREKAEDWAQKNSVSGTITELPLDTSAYEHAVMTGLFKPKKPHEMTPRFIAEFSSRLWHGHIGPDWNLKGGE